MSEVAARFVVAGRVQGVGFRAWTRRQAQALGLRGHAMNLADGRVEVLAAGAPGAINALDAALRRGPALAQVDSVQRVNAAMPDHDGFRTG
jgi:acylphosphatase